LVTVRTQFEIVFSIKFAPHICLGFREFLTKLIKTALQTVFFFLTKYIYRSLIAIVAQSKNCPFGDDVTTDLKNITTTSATTTMASSGVCFY
jgi:hypothetical protein